MMSSILIATPIVIVILIVLTSLHFLRARDQQAAALRVQTDQATRAIVEQDAALLIASRDQLLAGKPVNQVVEAFAASRAALASQLFAGEQPGLWSDADLRTSQKHQFDRAAQQFTKHAVWQITLTVLIGFLLGAIVMIATYQAGSGVPTAINTPHLPITSAPTVPTFPALPPVTLSPTPVPPSVNPPTHGSPANLTPPSVLRVPPLISE